MVPNLALDLIIDRVDLVDEGDNSESFIRMYKRKEKEQMDIEQILAKMETEHAEVIRTSIAKAKSDGMAEGKAASDAEYEPQLEKAKTDAEAAFDELETVKKSKSADAEPDFEDVIKNLDPTVQTYMRTMKAKQDAAETAARVITEKAVHDEAVSKAKEFKSIPVEEDKLVAVMKSASPEVIEILAAANAAIDKGGIFDEIGKSKGNGAGTSTDAWSKIEKRAAEVAKDTGVTMAKAINDVIKANPDMYREYLKEDEA